MIEVTQRRRFRPDDHPDGPQRGDCYAACVASLFELPYAKVAAIDGTAQSLSEWTKARYPALSVSCRMLGDSWKEVETAESYKTWPTHHYEGGHWIASIWSPRIPDVERFDCGCAYGEDNQPKPPNPDCRWCHGKPHERSMGISWGLHAVVMRNAKVVWDPHPDAQPMDEIFFRSATTWVVADPALLKAAA